MKTCPVHLKNVSIDDAFWSPRIRIAREAGIPYQWAALNDRVPGAAKSGAVRNFKIAAGRMKGEFRGCVFQDSDLAKWIEAAAFSLTTHPDKKLERELDRVVDLIADAQQKDGYVGTAFTVKDRDKRWTNLQHDHELYVIGHLIEAAVAYFEATGKRRFLDVMARAADHVATVFGTERGKKRGYPGHEEIELALIRLYRATEETKYLDLSRYFIDERGRTPSYFEEEARKSGRPRPHGWQKNFAYSQSHAPVREQSDAVGHAVRAMYLYSAMADIARETGDKTLVTACKRLWKSATRRRMYLTGGVGSSATAGEAFTLDYELPNETAYAETCAAIGLVFWAHRMLALEADADYADVMERALYNGVLSGVSLDWRRFFYKNPLRAYPGSRIDGYRPTRRAPWHGCACCPPNLLRLLTSLGGYIYGQTRRELFVHLYVGGKTDVTLAGQHVEITQSTRYPWADKIRLTLRPESPVTFTLSLRIPGWCRHASLAVNGNNVKLSAITKKGYARVTRRWSRADRVVLSLPMPAARVYAHPRVRHSAGSVALQRGPIVYCLEEVDNGPDLAAVMLPATSRLREAKGKGLLAGIPIITAKAYRAERHDRQAPLYRTSPPGRRPATIQAVPYFLWANRAEGEMTVWIREV